MKLYRSGSGRLLLATDKEVLVQKLLYPTEWRRSSLLHPNWLENSTYFTLIGNNVKLRQPK